MCLLEIFRKFCSHSSSFLLFCSIPTPSCLPSLFMSTLSCSLPGQTKCYIYSFFMALNFWSSNDLLANSGIHSLRSLNEWHSNKKSKQPIWPPRRNVSFTEKKNHSRFILTEHVCVSFSVCKLRLSTNYDLITFWSLLPKDSKRHVVVHLCFSVRWKACAIGAYWQNGTCFFFKSRAKQLSFSYAPSEGRRKLSVWEKYQFGKV